ncbi:MAG TPA: PQQ-binding-like beta-propeller repeat protein [Candidatus Acidoferrales bacterium]|nr:PQQ-binding-like beta-propeller repeat protein [Candidatus Acidoferrales bacterium]
MRWGWMMKPFGAAILLAFLATGGQAQFAAGDWPLYRHDVEGMGYSALKQINTTNVSTLTESWTFTLSERGGLEVTPIAVRGVMYLPGTGKVYALDGATGKEIWHYDVPMAPTRGVAYWPGDKDHSPRIIFTTFNRKMIALDAATGKIISTFGKNGVVEMEVGYNGVPTIYKNLVFLGASVGELPVGPPGDSRAYDAITGNLIWDFHTVPQPGEVGHDSWLNDGWKGRSGTNVWGWYMTVDPKSNTLFMPIGGPSPNYYGGDRPGNNLFGNSIVAVDSDTGRLKWYFQTIHHDLWDQDLPPGAALVDVRQNGKEVPALVTIGKTGLMFILNRDTGKPVFGVEERPVAKGDVPGEWYSPTQPFPLKPPPLARTTYKPEDMVTADDTTSEHAKACQDLLAKSGGSLYNAGPFTGWLYHEDGTPPKTTIQFPGGTGGTNWGGTAIDPTNGYIFVQTHDMSLMGWMEKKKTGANYGRGTEGSTQLYDRASVDGPGPYFGFSVIVKDANGHPLGNWPCQKPPWGKLYAINANTGDIVWQSVVGITEGLPSDKQNTGGGGSAGPIATAGGLVFIGATPDNRFRAIDAKTGRELWVIKLGKNANADPMTYQAMDGKQYVAIVAVDSVYVFALP